VCRISIEAYLLEYLWYRDCNGKAQQNFVYDDQKNTFELQNKCLDLPGGSTKNGNGVEIWDCTPGSANQLWTMSDGTIQFKSTDGKQHCMDLLGANTTNGAAIGLWDCIQNQKSQQWTFGGAPPPGPGPGESYPLICFPENGLFRPFPRPWPRSWPRPWPRPWPQPWPRS
jgi:hypothetical protein